MRYSKLVLLSTLSAFALMGSSTARAVSTAEPVDLGMLQSKKDWNVGAVNTQNINYCAMVGQFDQNVSLAFARNPDGFGSLAIDFNTQRLETGKTYEVMMQVDDQEARQYTVRAANPRSLIVQIGQDEEFYNALSGNGTLNIEVGSIDMSFLLNKFSRSYISLINCADKLQHRNDGPRTAAMPVPPVEKTPLPGAVAAPVVAAAEAKTTPDSAQKAPPKTTAQAVTDVTSKTAETTKTESQQAPAPQAAPVETVQKAPLKEEKTTLASLTSSIKDMIWKDDKNTTPTASKPTAPKPAAPAAANTATPAVQATAVATPISLSPSVKEPTATVASSATKAVAAPSSKDGKPVLASSVVVPAGKTPAKDIIWTDGLASTELSSKSSSFGLLEENFQLKTKLAQSQLTATELQNKLDILQLDKDKLASQIDMQDRQSKVMEAALSAKEHDLSSVRTDSIEDSKTVAQLREELAALKHDQSIQMSALQSQLAVKTAQYETLQKQFSTASNVHKSVSQEAEEAQAELDVTRQALIDAQAKLAASEQQRTETASQMDAQGQQSKTLFEKMKDQLDNARRQISMLQSQMMSVTVQRDELASQLDAQTKQNSALRASLNVKNKELAALNAGLRLPSSAVPPADGQEPFKIMPDTEGAADNTLAGISPSAGSDVFSSKNSFIPAITPQTFNGEDGATVPVLKLKASVTKVRPSAPSDGGNWDTVIVQ